MEQINKIIEYLIAICNFSKDIHYNCKGDAFYSKHLLVDRVCENLNDYIDSIKEVFFLGGANKEPLPSYEYLKKAAELIPEIQKEDKKNFEKLRDLLIAAIKQIEKTKALSKGEENLIGSIAENLQTSLGLINQQVK